MLAFVMLRPTPAVCSVSSNTDVSGSDLNVSRSWPRRSGDESSRRMEPSVCSKASAQPAGFTTETTLAGRQSPSFWSSRADLSKVTLTSAPRFGRTLTSYLTVLALVSVVVGAAPPPPKRARTAPQQEFKSHRRYRSNALCLSALGGLTARLISRDISSYKVAKENRLALGVAKHEAQVHSSRPWA